MLNIAPWPLYIGCAHSKPGADLDIQYVRNRVESNTNSNIQLERGFKRQFVKHIKQKTEIARFTRFAWFAGLSGLQGLPSPKSS